MPSLSMGLEDAAIYLHGEVYGHPRLTDGRMVTTSSVIKLRDDVAVTQSGTIYRLGKCLPETGISQVRPQRGSISATKKRYEKWLRLRVLRCLPGNRLSPRSRTMRQA